MRAGQVSCAVAAGRSEGWPGLGDYARSPCVPSSCCRPTTRRRTSSASCAPSATAAPDADVLVVDDNSPDGTAALAEETAAELGRIKVLHRAGKQGLGAAYRHGFTTAFDEGYEAIVSMDADFSHDPAVIPTMLQLRRRRRRCGDRVALRAGWRHGRLAAASPAAVEVGQPVHGCGAAAAGPRLHVGVPRVPRRRAASHRSRRRRPPRATRS